MKAVAVKAIIFLPTQGPHLQRTGDKTNFDWHEQCRLAAATQKIESDSIIYVPSAFQQKGTRSELDFYQERLNAEGVADDSMVLEMKGLDSVEQCELALEFARRLGARLIAVSCATHYRRVRYLLKGGHVEHRIAVGTPNRWLAFTHLVLALVFPVLDALGLRHWWKLWVARRRLEGRQ